MSMTNISSTAPFGGNPRIARLADARTLLFVPGNRPERFDKALATGADAIVLDLEDAVPAEDKARAREAIAASSAAWNTSTTPVVVRINPPTSAQGMLDLEWLATLAVQPPAVMVPKAESAHDLARVQAVAPAACSLPLVESAAGWAALDALATAPGVLRLVLGHLDFMADTGIVVDAEESELAPLRFAIAMATRLAGLASAIDGVTTAFDDEAQLRKDTRRALGFGFGGKLCIHPKQVAMVHAAMAPSDAETQWAKRVVDGDRAAGGAAFQLDGRMVDAPVVLKARRILARVR